MVKQVVRVDSPITGEGDELIFAAISAHGSLPVMVSFLTRDSV